MTDGLRSRMTRAAKVLVDDVRRRVEELTESGDKPVVDGKVLESRADDDPPTRGGG